MYEPYLNCIFLSQLLILVLRLDFLFCFYCLFKHSLQVVIQVIVCITYKLYIFKCCGNMKTASVDCALQPLYCQKGIQCVSPLVYNGEYFVCKGINQNTFSRHRSLHSIFYTALGYYFETYREALRFYLHPFLVHDKNKSMLYSCAFLFLL